MRGGIATLFVSITLILGIVPAFANSGEPLQIVVSISQQHLRVFQGGYEIAQSRVSSGKKGHATPTGIFSILQKNRHHRSNIYSGAPMPFMQRLTWSGIALHASNSVPDHPASHGCVRLPHHFAGELFRMNTRGVHVIIENNPGTPQEVAHSNLFMPQVSYKTSQKHDRWVNNHIEQNNLGFFENDTDHPARILITRRTAKDDMFEVQRLLNKLGYNAGDVDGIMGPATWKAITGFQKASGREPNGFVNSELLDALYRSASEQRPAGGRILVRKHTRTIFTAEMEILEPEKPLGTHLLLASQMNPEDGFTRWLSMSLEDRIHQPIHTEPADELQTGTTRVQIYNTLARIKFDENTRQQISRLLTPGSSIAISDNGISIETGEKGTDFIVLTKPDYSSEIASN